MPGAPGITYVTKTEDYMDRLLIRKCTTCGAKIGELCILRSGKRATKVTEVHSARFKGRNEKKSKLRADHYAAI